MASLFRDTKLCYVKTVSVTRSMTTATEVAKLPRGSRIVGLILNGTASDAGTTATLSIGSTSSSDEYVDAANVLSAGVGDGSQHLSGVAGALGAVITSDSSVYAKYAETGTASSAGSWDLSILFSQSN
jgi:hypothetical protein